MSQNTKQQEETLEETIIKVQETDCTLRRAFHDSQEYTRVILIGRTGASKSTISNALIGNPLRIAKKENGDAYLAAEGSQFNIGNTNVSNTSVPNVYVDHQNRFLICDAPGFDDTRGPSQDMINSFAIDQLFKAPCKIKILFVFGANETSVAGRSQGLTRNVRRLFEIFPDENQLKEALGIIISRGDGRALKCYINKFNNKNNSFRCQKFCQFALDNLETKVFGFNDAKLQEGEFYTFEDRDKIINFLKQNPIQNPEHKIVLSDQAKLKINEIVNNMGRIDDSVKELLKIIRQTYITENPELDKINELKDIFLSIQNELDQVQTPTGFTQIVINRIANPEPINEVISKIQCFDNIFTFMENIDGNDKPAQLINFKQNLKKIFNEEINNLITIIRVKTLQAQLRQSYQENSDIKERMAQLELTVEDKDEEKLKIENEIRELTERAKEMDRKNEEEREEIRKTLNEKLSYYQYLLDKASMDENSNDIASKFGPFSTIYKMVEKVIDFFD